MHVRLFTVLSRAGRGRGTSHHPLRYHHHSIAMSLLQDLLRTQTLDSLDKALSSGRTTPDDDEELINVVSILFLCIQSERAHLINVPKMSLPGSPGRSRPSSRPASRPHSPTRGSRPSPFQPLTALKSGPSRDPLRTLPTDISQKIFALLSIRDLSRCSRVSKKWNRSQTINYGAYQPKFCD